MSTKDVADFEADVMPGDEDQTYTVVIQPAGQPTGVTLHNVRLPLREGIQEKIEGMKYRLLWTNASSHNISIDQYSRYCVVWQPTNQILHPNHEVEAIRSRAASYTGGTPTVIIKILPAGHDYHPEHPANDYLDAAMQ